MRSTCGVKISTCVKLTIIKPTQITDLIKQHDTRQHKLLYYIILYYPQKQEIRSICQVAYKEKKRKYLIHRQW